MHATVTTHFPSYPSNFVGLAADVLEANLPSDYLTGVDLDLDLVNMVTTPGFGNRGVRRTCDAAIRCM